MEKIQIPKNNSSTKKLEKAGSSVWDCESTLYDSFELNSFRKQLDSAISARTLSMPHLTSTDHARRRRHSFSFDDPLPPLPPPLSSSAVSKNKNPASKLARSVQKLLKSVFKMNKVMSCHSSYAESPRSWDGAGRRREERFFVVYDKSASLTTIPEGPEVDHCGTGSYSPEIGSLVGRTASDRFLISRSPSVAAPLGISRA